MSSETDLFRNQAIQNQRNSFSRGFPLLFNVETLQAFGALFQIPHYYRKFLLHCKSKMLCNYVINTTHDGINNKANIEYLKTKRYMTGPDGNPTKKYLGLLRV
jgi:hypothetical protein